MSVSDGLCRKARRRLLHRMEAKETGVKNGRLPRGLSGTKLTVRLPKRKRGTKAARRRLADQQARRGLAPEQWQTEETQ